MDAAELLEIDRKTLIHPVSPYRAHEARGATILTGGSGLILEDAAGERLLDAFAGLWCVNIGYGQESVVAAASRQMRALPYATGYFGYTSEPAIRLAGKLVDLSPPSVSRVYFTQGGSDSVDSAIRFITLFWNARGQPAKKHMIALERGYHGSSSTSAGLTGLPVFHHGFDLPLAWQHHIPPPYAYRDNAGRDGAALIAASVQALRDKVEEIGLDRVAAFFVEPVLGSGGVIVPPAGWLRAMRQTCDELGILLVVDEVITGFGRTGPLFACEHENVCPDVMTVAKGLTAGYVPMGAVLISEALYEAIADGRDGAQPVGHGHTYSGHPVSAAVALEVLRLYFEAGILANGQAREPAFAERLRALRTHPLVGDVRSKGLLAGIELVADQGSKQRFDTRVAIADRLTASARKNRIIFRAFPDGTIGLAPALVCMADEIDLIFDRLEQTLDDVLAQAEVREAMSTTG